MSALQTTSTSTAKPHNPKPKFVGVFLAQVLLLTLFLVITVRAGAQQQFSSQFSALLAGMATNARQLRQYTFKQRTEAYHKDELKSAKTDEIHYDAAGERVTIPLDQQSVQSSEPRRRGPGSRLMARVVEEKREETKEYIERLMALTSRYVALDPTKLQSAMAGADVSMPGGSGQVRITMRDYVKSGDVMSMSFDSATNRPTRTEVQTTLDGAPVSIVLVFDQLRDGPNYPGRIVVRSETRHLAVRVFTYDYRR